VSTLNTTRAEVAISHVSDCQPGITRRGAKRFRYVDQVSGEEIDDPEILARIKALAVPPAWSNVWICVDPAGHIQATGRDAKGRKQYRYHAHFRQRRERRKFHGLMPFGQALGELRKRIDADLRQPTLSRERVLAAVLALLERTFVRVGNEEYARANRSFGLTTLRGRHAKVNGSELRLLFVGKGGKRFDVSLSDPRLARVVRRCQDLPGQLLFQHIGDDGEPVPVSSGDVNDYLREVTGIDVTAKTFRTWGASLLAALELVDLDPPTSERAAASAIRAALEPVAARLGNTIAVCRASYVHPKVLSTFTEGKLSELWDTGPRRAAAGLTADERRLLRLLRGR
jgi:DNA topoisomerase-1